jgi:protoporphyrinogen oxidase
LINRFGRQLYLTFFKSYTEKVWGIAGKEIPAEWGAQRIKGLSLTSALKHFLKKNFGKREEALAQKGTDTSLIEHFLYPKLGAGPLGTRCGESCGSGGARFTWGGRERRIARPPRKISGVSILSRIITNRRQSM